MTWNKGVFDATLEAKTKTMETREYIMIRHFLSVLEEQYQDSERLKEPIAAAFVHLLNRRELIAILTMMFGGTEHIKEEYPHYEKASNEEILYTMIKDEYYILQYLLNVTIKKFTL